jgi:hypothetical protein
MIFISASGRYGVSYEHGGGAAVVCLSFDFKINYVLQLLTFSKLIFITVITLHLSSAITASALLHLKEAFHCAALTAGTQVGAMCNVTCWGGTHGNCRGAVECVELCLRCKRNSRSGRFRLFCRE